MKLALVIVFLVAGCKKDAPGSTQETGSGSAVVAATPDAAPTPPPAPVEDVACDVASKAFAKKMAALPGNVLSDAKPDDGLIYYTAISMEDYCTGEPGNTIVPWTAQERACVKSADNPESCFTGNALSQVKFGLNEVVTTALANQKKNAAAAGSAGSAAEKPE
jgi:hypothetical protein